MLPDLAAGGVRAAGERCGQGDRQGPQQASRGPESSPAACRVSDTGVVYVHACANTHTKNQPSDCTFRCRLLRL